VPSANNKISELFRRCWHIGKSNVKAYQQDLKLHKNVVALNRTAFVTITIWGFIKIKTNKPVDNKAKRMINFKKII
jgi:hypothetical protein